MQHLASQLAELGLSDYESRVYAALLEQSPMGAALIARKCDLSRSSVYTTLNTLIGKGYVGTTYRNEVKQFFAEDLSAVQNTLESEAKKLVEQKHILATLEKTVGQLRGMINVPSITIFEGQEGLKKIYRSMIRDAQQNEILHIMRNEFVWEPDWKFVFEQEWHDSIKKNRKEKNIVTHLLVNASAEEKRRAAFYKTRKGLIAKTLPAKYMLNNFALYILGDTVSVLSFEHNHLVGIKIVNRIISENFRQLFQVQWENAKQVK